MKAYTLHDIEIFIGAAGNAVCEDKIFPQECDLADYGNIGRNLKETYRAFIWIESISGRCSQNVDGLIKKRGGEYDDAGRQDAADA